MRGLGMGQSIHVLIVSQVMRLIRNAVGLGGYAIDPATFTYLPSPASLSLSAVHANEASPSSAMPISATEAIVTWAFIAQVQAQRTQLLQLQKQKLSHHWRKAALQGLLRSSAVPQEPMLPLAPGELDKLSKGNESIEKHHRVGRGLATRFRSSAVAEETKEDPVSEDKADVAEEGDEEMQEESKQQGVLGAEEKENEKKDDSPFEPLSSDVAEWYKACIDVFLEKLSSDIPKDVSLTC